MVASPCPEGIDSSDFDTDLHIGFQANNPWFALADCHQFDITQVHTTLK